MIARARWAAGPVPRPSPGLAAPSLDASSRRALWSVLFVAVFWLALATGATAADVLRVCADPDNLPFSSATSAERGLYVDLAELVAAKLGLTTEYTWWATYYGRRAVRNTLLAERCEAYFGLPNDASYMGRSLALTRPFLDVGYAIIAPATLAFQRLDDLKDKRVAVQFGSPPQIVMATRDGFQVTTFKLAEEALDALRKGEVDAAFVWGPVAGHYNKRTLGGGYRLVPVAGEGMQWQVSVGVKNGHDALRAALDGALAQLGPEIRALADRYGFPSGPPMSLAAQGAVTSAGAPTPQAGPAAGVPAGDPAQARVDLIPRGRSVFNQHCAHCHSPNAQSPEPSRDLRRLKRRYGDAMTEVFYKTVTDGRPDKGMPPWKEVLRPGDIKSVATFLESVQAEP